MLTVFSAIQATGRVHLGNYFGLINYYLQSQKTKGFQRDTQVRMLLSIADLHGLTNPLKGNIAHRAIDTAAFLLATGINPKNVIIFRQSDVLEHTGLLWLLLCQSSVPRLARMIQWQVHKSDSNVINRCRLGKIHSPRL